jgi:putative membrane protein
MRYLWVAVFVLVLTWSGINPKDFQTWVLEVAPAVIAFVLLGSTYRKFRFTPLVYTLILIHCIILMVGGHYTYAEVPLFDGLFGMDRNNYDKLGHLAQGFIPAMVAREILIRNKVVRPDISQRNSWRNLFIVSFCLGFSAFYELIEWWVAELAAGGAEAFLGTQGYVWDTQSDMGFALLGAIIALASLAHFHDRQLSTIAGEDNIQVNKS